MAVSKNQSEENALDQTTETGPTLLRGQFSRPALLFKAKAPKFSPGKVKYYFFFLLISYC